MRDFILITGASSGLGEAMARLLAKQQFNLIVVARRMDRLESLSRELQDHYGVTVMPMQADLSDPDQALKLYADIKAKGCKVSMLINNAGFGDYGDFIDLPLGRQVAMINLNCTALVVLTKAFLEDRKTAGSGTILNIASLLAYLPFPYYSVYSATKAFVLAFSETLAAELEGTGIAVNCLCPGPIATDFNSSAMLGTRAYQANKPLPAMKVAEVAVRHLLNGKGSKKVGFNTWFISNLPRITPDRLMMKIKKRLASAR